jgi:hypothetical protein
MGSMAKPLLYSPSPDSDRFLCWSEIEGKLHFFATQDEARAAAKKMLKTNPDQIVHVARLIATSEES